MTSEESFSSIASRYGFCCVGEGLGIGTYAVDAVFSIGALLRHESLEKTFVAGVGRLSYSHQN